MIFQAKPSFRFALPLQAAWEKVRKICIFLFQRMQNGKRGEDFRLARRKVRLAIGQKTYAKSATDVCTSALFTKGFNAPMLCVRVCLFGGTMKKRLSIAFYFLLAIGFACAQTINASQKNLGATHIDIAKLKNATNDKNAPVVYFFTGYYF